MLNEAGGVIDDLIVYFLTESWFRIVVNAGTRDKDLAWMRTGRGRFGVELTERTDLAMLAVQGPNARAKVAELLPAEHRDAALALEVFFGRELSMKRRGTLVRRAAPGYTGEDGFEIMLPAGEAARVWRALNDHGVKSAGLGARDTLRLEAAMNLYGNDMDESQNPLESGSRLDCVVRKSCARLHRPQGARVDEGRRPREEIRRAAARGPRRPARPSEGADTGGRTGEITSGTFSPTMEKSIALARVPRATPARSRSTCAASF
jgi:aminomethyltransferase